MRRGTILLAALVLGATAACSEPRAGTLPPRTTSPTPRTPAATTTAPTSYADELRSAIDQYYEALTAAANDPAARTDELAALIERRCTCREVLRVLRDEASRGYRLDYSYSVSNVKIVRAEATYGDALYTVVQSAGRRRDSRGRVIASYRGSEQRFAATFIRRGDTWLLYRANQVPG